MKILIYGLNTWPEPVGIGRYTGELSAWLAERGHEVRAIAAPPYFPNWRVGLGGEVGAPQYRNRYLRERIGGVRLRRCPLWVPARPNGLTRL
ncbi:MAG: glycosyltransferase, partial [Cyanobacteriota bacterium]